jgi:GNAT superfamily N-acetyltransferase
MHLAGSVRKVRAVMLEQVLSELPYRGLRPFCRLIAASSDEARLIERDGVVATVVPVTPERSITNSVVYERPEALEQALEPLAAVYAEAGIRAWTVWVPERDRAARDLLDRAGHRLDAAPAAMALELSGFRPTPPSGLDLDRDPPASVVGRINDAAYGFDGEFARAFATVPADVNVYAARLDGEAAACVGTIHDQGDCGIYLVGTLPEARGRGLASKLMTVALEDARAAGCETASLQSTAMGKPIYTKLGFRDFGTIQMWERRVT